MTSKGIMTRNAHRLIGLTGNMGCGKSTVGKILASHGVPLIDADEIARQITARGTPVLAEISRVFGAGVLTSSGELDRKKLRGLVFKDPALRKNLEGLTHPLIQERTSQAMKKLFQDGSKLVVYEAPLLLEAGREGEFDGILVVTCRPDLQLSRALSRDPSLSSQVAEQMIKAQMPQEEKAKRARWVIDNSGSLSELASQVEAWLKRILENP